MHVVMGANGHVGSAVADALLRRGEPVSVMLHSDRSASAWKDKGARVVRADVNDIASLRRAFEQGDRVFLLNPPADPASDTDAVERQGVAHLLAALEGLELEKVVAASTAGAQPGDRVGDLSVLWELEEGLRKQSIPAAINRGAYYMSNWDGLVDTVRSSLVLPTLFPADLALPMVAPQDLGEAAAVRMLSDVGDVGIRQVEGPKHYSANDVARAFALALGRPVKVAEIPRPEWRGWYLRLGFSEAAADAYVRMTAASVDQGFERVGDAVRGPTKLETYIEALVKGR